MEEMSTDPKPIAWFAPWTWKRRWGPLITALLVFVAYPLSIGPVSGLMFRGWIPTTFVRLFYTPLDAIVGMNSTAVAVVRWYIQLFNPFR